MKLRTLIVSSLIALSLAACNAGSSLPTPGATSTPSSTSTPGVTPTAIATGAVIAPVTQTLSVATTASTIAAPSAGGYAPAITIPGLTAAFSAPVTTTNIAPVGVSAFSARGPIALGNRGTLSKPSNATNLLYVSFTPQTNTVVTAGTVGFSFALPSAPTTDTAFYLAFYDGKSWHTELSTTAGTLTSTGVNFSLTLGGNFPITAGTTYAVVLYAVPAAATPAPSTLTATSTPGVVVTAAPTSGTFSTTTSQTFSGITTADGSTGSITIPALTNGGTFTYAQVSSAPTTVSTSGITATFLGGVTVTSPSNAVTIPASSQFGFSLTPSSSIVGKTLSLYALSSGSPVLVGTATATATGVSATPASTSTFNVPASSSYTFAIYYNK